VKGNVWCIGNPAGPSEQGLGRSKEDGNRFCPSKISSTRTDSSISADNVSMVPRVGAVTSIATARSPQPPLLELAPATARSPQPPLLGMTTVTVSSGPTEVGAFPKTPEANECLGVGVSPKGNGSFTVSYDYPTALNTSNPKKSIEELAQLFTFQVRLSLVPGSQSTGQDRAREGRGP